MVSHHAAMYTPYSNGNINGNSHKLRAQEIPGDDISMRIERQLSNVLRRLHQLEKSAHQEDDNIKHGIRALLSGQTPDGTAEMLALKRKNKMLEQKMKVRFKPRRQCLF